VWFITRNQEESVSLTPAIRSWMLRLYPRAWRERYGEEFAALLEEYPLTPFAYGDIFLGALDAHLKPFDANGRILRMLNQPRRSAITVFCAYTAFVLAGIAYNQTIEDDVRRMNAAYPAVAAAYWVVLVGSVVALLAVLAGGLPVGLAVARQALTQRRWDILLLLAVPPIALAVWLGWTWALINLIGPAVGATTDSQPLAGLFFISWSGLFGLMALASTAAVSIAVARSEVPTPLFRFALGPAAVATLAMVVMFGAVLVWGLLVHAQLPSYMDVQTGPRPYSVSVTVAWLAVLLVMALATVVAAAAVVRGWRTPPAPSGASGAPVSMGTA
jgi:hypothetical protein